MPPSKFTYGLPPAFSSSAVPEDGIESGFIWHTTGSGKTLASFKASTLLSKLLSGELSVQGSTN